MGVKKDRGRDRLRRLGDERRFWETLEVSFDELPTYADLLRAADGKLLAKAVLERETGVPVGEQRGKRAKKARKEIEKAIGKMRAADEEHSDGDLLLPARRADEGDRGQVGLRISAELVSRSDLPRAAGVLEAESGFATRGEWERLIEGAQEGDEPLPGIDCYAYGLSPRAEILGYRCWIGRGFSRLERYRFLADAFYEATFFGLDEGKAEELRAGAVDELEKTAGDLDAGRAGTTPAETVLGGYGLAPLGDDLESEHSKVLMGTCAYLNAVLARDLHAQMADLWERMEKREGEATGGQAPEKAGAGDGHERVRPLN